MQKQMGKWRVAAGMAATVGAVALTGCQCTPPVRERVETRTVYDVSRTSCAPVKTKQTITVIRTEDACPSLPPVGEITVVRNDCSRTKMVFVKVRPSDDRCYDIESRSFERPWPWGSCGLTCNY